MADLRILRPLRRTLAPAGLLVGCLLASAAGWGAATPSLETRVRQLEDREEIRELLIEYGHRLDTHDLAGYSQLFASNGEWIGGFGRATGPQAILALMEKSMGTTPFDPKAVKGFHLLTNVIIHLDGDHASALSKLVYIMKSPDNKPVPVLGGHYDDKLIRENGHWKFLERVVMLDIPYQDPNDEKTVIGSKAPSL